MRVRNLRPAANESFAVPVPVPVVPGLGFPTPATRFPMGGPGPVTGGLGLAAASIDAMHPMRKVLVFSALMLVFSRFSMLPEVLSFVYHVPSFIYYLLYFLAIVSTVMTGGLARLSQAGPFWAWMAFFGWMVAATPFGSWIGGSIEQLITFLKGAVLMLVIITCSFANWRECRGAMKAMALGYIVLVFVSQFLNSDRGGRISLSFGTVGNSNDLACHLLLALPAMLFILMSSASRTLYRMAALLFVGWGLNIILGSASRGALVSLVCMGLFFLFFGPGRARLMLIPIVIMGILAMALFVKKGTSNRLMSMFSSEASAESSEAKASWDQRQLMIRNGLLFVRSHPLVGVGPGQFSDFNGKFGDQSGEQRTYWANAHNSYLAAAAETGIPGFFCYLAAFWMTFRILWKSYQATKGRREEILQDISLASFCMLLGFLGFSIAIFFLNFTYLFHAPTLTGLAICLSRAAQRAMGEANAAAGQPALARPGWTMPTPTPRPA